MTDSADPDQLASEANWSGSTLFAKTGRIVFSKRRVKIYKVIVLLKHVASLHVLCYGVWKNIISIEIYNHWEYAYRTDYWKERLCSKKPLSFF